MPALSLTPNSEEATMAYQTINPTTNELVEMSPNHTDADIEAALTTSN